MNLQKRIENLETRMTVANFPAWCYANGVFDASQVFVLPCDGPKLEELENFLSANPGEREKIIITKIFTTKKSMAGV